jgi:hypothetical protein
MKAWWLVPLAFMVGCGDGEEVPVDGEDVDAGANDAAVPDGAASDAAVAPMIISPPNGTALRARRQEFEWTGAGSNYRLRIGTTSGASDIYDSPPLGDATSVTVDGLPLTGEPIFATLLSGPDDARVSSTNQYTAPLRRGLAVVVDFADASLEGWPGAGMNSLADVGVQLDEMEAHWDWLSRGLEKTAWDIARVELPVDLSDTAYPGWVEFREAVVLLVAEQVDFADYDVDSDGFLDDIWAIVADHGTHPPYAIGGSSRHQGAYIFVDSQDSDSIVGHHTGNFNHELAHALDVPDLYGTYDTLTSLTVMSDSWALPPNDFTAFERIRLGWVEPLVVAETIEGLELPNASEQPFAVKIPTGRSEEYFLLEYRNRPESGYGSAGFDHDGLAVYHVLEPSNQWADPPLVKLEPADGTTVLSAPERTDLAYPENPGMVLPLLLRTYFGGDPVVRIDDLRWTTDGTIAVDLTVLSTGPGSAVNRIVNSTVETGTWGWGTGGWRPDQATFSWASIGADGSSHSLEIASETENDVEWSTPVDGLVPGRGHYLCGSLKGENVTGGRGATLSISGTYIHTVELYGTFDWTRRCTLFAPATPGFAVACRLGGFSFTTSGRMWCDDVTLFMLESAFDAADPS